LSQLPFLIFFISLLALRGKSKKKMLLGYGYGGFWTTELRNQIASHAHNGYLDTILELGLVGLFLFILFILKLILKSLESLKNNINLSFYFLPLIFIIILRCIAESPFGEFINSSMWLVLCWSFIVNDKNKIIDP